MNQYEEEREEWKTIEGTDGQCEISNLGRLRRYAKPTYYQGYPKAKVKINGKSKLRSIHVLVAEAFIGPRPEGAVIDHKDGNRGNCRPENLEYITHQENLTRAHVQRRKRAKLSDDEILTFRALADDGIPIKRLSAYFGISENSGYALIAEKVCPSSAIIEILKESQT
jgi:hypothetical protein